MPVAFLTNFCFENLKTEIKIFKTLKLSIGNWKLKFA